VDSENAGNGGFERTSETVEFRERWRRWISKNAGDGGFERTPETVDLKNAGDGGFKERPDGGFERTPGEGLGERLLGFSQ
jgi:hypothetical protein